MGDRSFLRGFAGHLLKFWSNLFYLRVIENSYINITILHDCKLISRKICEARSRLSLSVNSDSGISYEQYVRSSILMINGLMLQRYRERRYELFLLDIPPPPLCRPVFHSLLPLTCSIHPHILVHICIMFCFTLFTNTNIHIYTFDISSSSPWLLAILLKLI